MAEGGGNKPPDRGKPRDENKMDDSGEESESFFYMLGDTAPYRVYVEKVDRNEKINKFSLGSLLKKDHNYDGSVTEMKDLGKNKIIMFFNGMTKANLMVTEKVLREKGYKAYIPRHLVSISGVLTGIPTEITNNEILEAIECSRKIISVYRLSRHVEGNKVPTNRVSITFRASQLPEKIKLFCTSCKVYPFIRKIQFCTNCH